MLMFLLLFYLYGTDVSEWDIKRADCSHRGAYRLAKLANYIGQS